MSMHVTLRHVEKHFGPKRVLQGINLELVPGEFAAIVGKSGCGKSTLLRLIAGLEPLTTGDLLIDGEPLRGLNRTARVMFQDARLLPWKRALANIELGLDASLHRQAAEMLVHVGLRDHAQAWPATLSGGERQRVALARALVTRPPLLLLDEPLGALDALTRIEMQTLIERLWLEQGFTALLITHDVEEAIAIADRVLLIENGRIALDVRVDLPRPRPRGSAAFAALKDTILRRVLGNAEVGISNVV